MDGSQDEVERWKSPFAWMYSLMSGNPRSNRDILEVAELGPDDQVLDVGCGPGAAVRRASRRAASAVGADPSDAMVRIAQRRSGRHPKARFEVGDAAALPLDDDSVTVAWTVSAYHHWPDRAAGLAELRRVVAPGGRVLIMERRLRKPGGHGMAEEEVAAATAALESAGFTNPTVSTRRPGLVRVLVVRADA